MFFALTLFAVSLYGGGGYSYYYWWHS